MRRAHSNYDVFVPLVVDAKNIFVYTSSHKQNKQAAEAYEAPSTSYATTSNSNAKQYSADRAGNVHAKGVGAFRSGLSWQRTARQKNLMKSQMR